MRAYIVTVIFCSIASCVLAQDWNTFESSTHKFSIFSPSELIINTQEAMTEIGQIQVNSYGYLPESDDNLLYQVIIYAYPEGSISQDSVVDQKEFLRELAYATIEQDYSELIYSEIIEYYGKPGILWRMKVGEDIMIKAKAILHFDQVYIIQVMSPKDNALNSSINKFINSFQLIN